MSHSSICATTNRAVLTIANFSFLVQCKYASISTSVISIISSVLSGVIFLLDAVCVCMWRVWKYDVVG